MSNTYGPPSPSTQATSHPGQTLNTGLPHPQLPPVPRRLATAAIWLAVALTAVMAANAATSYPVSTAINDLMAGTATLASASMWFSVSMILAVALFAVMIAVFVVGGLWLSQSYDFAKAVDPTYRMRRSRVWVWLGWWVPIVLLWFPLQIVDDVRRATARDEPRSGLGVWWTAWLTSLLATNISGRLFNSEEVLSHDAIVVVAMFDAVAAVAAVVACIRWISIIRGITRDQEAARG